MVYSRLAEDGDREYGGAASVSLGHKDDTWSNECASLRRFDCVG